MKSRTLFFSALLIIMPLVSNAQVGKLLRSATNKVVNSAAKATAKEANKEIDSAAQRKADQVVGNVADSIREDNKDNGASESGNQGSGGGGMGMGKLFGGKVTLKHNDEYSFTSRLYMQSETYDKDEVLKMDFYLFFSANTPSMGLETKSITNEQGQDAPISSTMVLDGENKCMIMLTNVNGSMMGIITPVNDSITQQNSKKNQKSTPTNFVKTGNTKVIAGYKCDEYSYTDASDKSSGKVWFTKDAKLSIDKRGWQSTGMANYYGYEGFKDGVILATETYDNKGKLTMKSETKEINQNFSHTISVKGYPLTQMNIGQGQPKK